MENTKDELDEQEKLVTVAKFMTAMEAQVARGALESAGIAVFLQGEIASQLYPGTLSTRLLVTHADEAAAKELLAATGGEVNGPEGDDAL